MPLDFKDYLTLNQVAKALGISRWTVYLLIKRGLLPNGDKLPGGAHIFHRRDVENLKVTEWFRMRAAKAKRKAAMIEPPATPTFPPKRGLSPEEQKKINAWIKAGKVKYLPAVGSKELATLEIKKYQQWLSNVGLPMKIKLGLVPLKHPERTEKERREHKRQQEREWHRKKREAKQLEPVA